MLHCIKPCTKNWSMLQRRYSLICVNDVSSAILRNILSISRSTNVLPDVAGGGRVGHDLLPQLDQTWIETRNKKAALKLEKLDTDLKNYKSNSIKESIRRGHDDLGDHYLDCGDLNNALKCYSRARDYCTSGKHIVNMCINVIKVSGSYDFQEYWI